MALEARERQVMEMEKVKEPCSVNDWFDKIIENIENDYPSLIFHRTNLVRYAPLNDEKLRYPNQEEINECMPALIKELEALCPNVIFLLGKIVGKNVVSAYGHKDLKLVEVFHPSYVYRFKKFEIFKKQVEPYLINIGGNENEH